MLGNQQEQPSHLESKSDLDIDFLKRKMEEVKAVRFYMDTMKLEPGKEDESAEEYKTKMGTKYEIADVELRAVKEYFSKLKFNFLELETKEQLLKKLFDEKSVKSCLQPDEVKELETSVAIKKKDLKDLKKEIEEYKLKIGEIAEELISRKKKLKAVFSERMSESMAQINELDDLDIQLKDLKAKTENIQGRTLEEVEAELEEQTQAMNLMVKEIENEKKKKKDLQWKLQSLQKEVQRQEKEYALLEKEVNEAKFETTQKDPEVLAKTQWYTETSNILEQDYNITVQQFMPTFVEYLYKVPKTDTTWPVRISFEGLHVRSIKVDGIADSFDDIISHARKFSLDLSHVVMELGQRITNYSLRTTEFQEMEPQYKVLATQNPNEYQVSNNETKIYYKIYVHKDYPSFKGPIKLVASNSKRSLSYFQNLIEQHKPTSVSDIIMICDMN